MKGGGVAEKKETFLTAHFCAINVVFFENDKGEV
jgi:hypothetical protein